MTPGPPDKPPPDEHYLEEKNMVDSNECLHSSVMESIEDATRQTESLIVPMRNVESTALVSINPNKALGPTGVNAYAEYILQLGISSETREQHQEALVESREKDLVRYKSENSWFKRLRTGKEPKASPQTKLLETLVSMGDEVTEGVNAFAKIPETLREMKEQYKELSQERATLRAKLRAYREYFSGFEGENERREKVVNFLGNYHVFTDEEKEEWIAKIKEWNNMGILPENLELSEILKDREYRILFIDAFEEERFESGITYEARKLELALFRDRYASVEKRLALSLVQEQEFLEYNRPKLKAVSNLKNDYEELSQESRVLLLSLDIDEVLKKIPKLIADAKEAKRAAKEQLNDCTCEAKARVRVGVDLDGQLAMSEISDDPCEDIDKILDRYSHSEIVVE